MVKMCGYSMYFIVSRPYFYVFLPCIFSRKAYIFSDKRENELTIENVRGSVHMHENPFKTHVQNQTIRNNN